MTPLDIDRIKQVDDFESLVVFLRDELDWPLETGDIENLSFDYEPEELGISDDVAVKINYIKQLRPLAENQPWGIFYIDFEPKKLPVVVLRRVLQKLIIKKRPGSRKSNLPGWHSSDLLFINSFGQQDQRGITLAHFRQEDETHLPTLKVIGWDGQDTPLHLDRCLNELGHLRFDPDTDAETWRENWSSAFTTTHRYTISTSKKLAQELAKLAKIVRVNAEHILKYETEGGRFKKAMAKFKTALIHDLTEEDFADMYAQTIAYGLLYTAIRSHVSGEATVVSAERVQQLVLPTNPFLTEVMESFFDIGSRKWSSEQEKLTGIDFDELGINDIVARLKNDKTDFDAILRDFNKKNPNEDPVIHFYELFLKEYDALKRKSRGVYYTPQPVVSFIVRSVDEVLKRDFNLQLGLADTITWGQMHKNNPDIKIPDGVSKDDFFVQILDPAIGTGTFLVETIDLIHKTMIEKWQNDGKSESEIKKLWNRYVPDSLLPRLYGFELMMAPYAIAHMKIGIKLYETGYENFEQDKKRVQVYLTNTLEEAIDTSGYLDTMDPAIAIESEQANEIKKTNSITVVIGNPPYSGHSFNNGNWIANLLRKKLKDGSDSYFKVDGNNLGERNPKWLNDDYVKFIRYAQYRLDNTGTGILGFITNHAYIDNPTFRGMRQSLMDTYQQINIIDLHGNAKKKEKCPDGSKDENVFEIQQGVAINIAAKLPTEKQSYNHSHLWGTKEAKNSRCKNSTLHSIKNLTELNPVSEMYLFYPQDLGLQSEFDDYIKITDAMLINSVGVVTGQDGKTIGNTSNEAKELARNLSIQTKTIQKVLYRPFQIKHIVYHKDAVTRMRLEVMQHMLAGENLGLVFQRGCSSGNTMNLPQITRSIIDQGTSFPANRALSRLAPLYLYPVEGELNFTKGDWPAGKNGRTPNLDKAFVNQFADSIGLEFVSDGKGDLKKTFGPEDLFNYIYAVFHSPVYRSRYAEFLKIDFPRVPIISNLNLFRKLCGFGDELVALHLMESDKLNDHITTFPVSGDNAVIKVGETKRQLADIENGKGKLYINKTQYFDNLPEEVWNFHIGGYQVCYKWLYDRKKAGRKLSAEDIVHYHKIVVALNETIKIMKQIDETIDTHGNWPGAFVTK